MGVGTCWEYANGQKIYVFEKNVPRGLSAPAPGLYTSVHLNIIFKQLLGNRLANQSQTLCGASLGKGNES